MDRESAAIDSYVGNLHYTDHCRAKLLTQGKKLDKFNTVIKVKFPDYGNAIWVIPEYRRSEAAVAMMNHLMTVADGLGIEIYVEGTMFSTPLFLKYGFVIIGHPTMIFHRDNPTPEWARLVRELQAQPVSIVWRPKRGIYHEGETILPWAGKPRQLKL
ncbi:hypothetical protein PT974_04823 [Cladobotryum mycophilum]|uniref:N-acetyltransferase domain-containing protein n=1 Tax=Cladobotryum mycophilum TaxID=491253 RepID=A0ABR0SQG8_9HYPO